MTTAAGSWALRIATTLLGVWCAANITIFKPAIQRLLPGDTFVVFPAAWAALVLGLFVRRWRDVAPSRALRTSVVLVILFALATMPTSYLQTPDADLERSIAIFFVAGQILLLGIALPRLFTPADYRWTLGAMAATFLVASVFLYVVNLLGLTHALGESLPLMNERGGLFRRGIVFHRNPNAYLFQWMPVALLVAALNAPARWRALPLLGFLIVFVQLTASFSRGSTLAVFLSLSPLLGTFHRAGARRFWVGVAIVLGVLAFAVWRVTELREYLMLGLNLNQRERIWADHLSHLWSSGKTLWGVGYFNYWMRGWWGPHNAYLAVLIFYGALGLVAYFAVLRDFALRIRRELRTRFGRLDTRLWIALLVSTLLWGLVEDSLSGPLSMPAFYFWLVTGMLSRPLATSRPGASTPLA